MARVAFPSHIQADRRRSGGRSLSGGGGGGGGCDGRSSPLRGRSGHRREAARVERSVGRSEEQWQGPRRGDGLAFGARRAFLADAAAFVAAFSVPLLDGFPLDGRWRVMFVYPLFGGKAGKARKVSKERLRRRQKGDGKLQ